MYIAEKVPERPESFYAAGENEGCDFPEDAQQVPEDFKNVVYESH
jgi:hypothetical protein